MSLTPACPACATVFLLTPEQLKLADGWVRCTACSHVFNAALQLDSEPEPPPAVEPVLTATRAAGPVIPRAPEVPRAAERSQAQKTATEPPATVHMGLRASDAATRGRAPPAPAALPPEPAAGAAPARTPAGESAAVPILESPAVAEPGFVRQARREAFWRSGGARTSLGLFACLLTVLLAGQWALHQRHWLAATQPGLAPWLGRACATLGCELGPLRRIDAVAIDSSSLVHRQGSWYDFEIVLKNAAPMPLAMPALELTLTQVGDAVLARRSFLPEELPGAPLVLPARGALALSLRLSLPLADGSDMTGYRSLVYYP
jgi:predicted Zn finger-like uncharacterized protein